MAQNKKAKGFTIIELLVVIAIIGVISTLAFAALQSARTKARNVKRLSDVKQYTIALAMAFEDNGAYPGSDIFMCLGEGYNNRKCWLGGTSNSENDGLNNILRKYIPDLPIGDSVCDITGYIYRLEPVEHLCGENEGRIRWLMEGNNQSCGPGIFGGDYGDGDCTICEYCTGY